MLLSSTNFSLLSYLWPQSFLTLERTLQVMFTWSHVNNAVTKQMKTSPEHFSEEVKNKTNWLGLVLIQRPFFWCVQGWSLNCTPKEWQKIVKTCPSYQSQGPCSSHVDQIPTECSKGIQSKSEGRDRGFTEEFKGSWTSRTSCSLRKVGSCRNTLNSWRVLNSFVFNDICHWIHTLLDYFM